MTLPAKLLRSVLGSTRSRKHVRCSTEGCLRCASCGSFQCGSQPLGHPLWRVRCPTHRRKR